MDDLNAHLTHRRAQLEALSDSPSHGAKEACERIRAEIATLEATVAAGARLEAVAPRLPEAAPAAEAAPVADAFADGVMGSPDEIHEARVPAIADLRRQLAELRAELAAAVAAAPKPAKARSKAKGSRR